VTPRLGNKPKVLALLQSLLPGVSLACGGWLRAGLGSAALLPPSSWAGEATAHARAREQPRDRCLTDQPVTIGAQGTWMCLSVLLGTCNPVSLAGGGTTGSQRMPREPGADVSCHILPARRR